MNILIVDDEESIRFSLTELLIADGHVVTAVDHGPAALETLEHHAVDLMLCDLSMPVMNGLEVLDAVLRLHPDVLFVLMTAYGDERTAVGTLTRGAFHYIPKPFDNDEIREIVERARELRTLRSDNRRMRRELAGEYHGLIGRTLGMREVFRMIQRAGPTDSTVLIEGESGTGKELVAHALHEDSPRRRHPFVALNCSALPDGLVESELFGHVRGAFTGADRDREGLFESAHRGTLFLDEIGDLGPAAQAKLLRALEERVIVRVGANRDKPVDVRIVAATHRSLDRLVEEGAFRADLLYRLKVVTVDVPPLRTRRSDIPILASHFAAECGRAHRQPIHAIDDSARRALTAYDWPGNVRELRNVIERAVVFSENGILTVRDLPPLVRPVSPPATPMNTALADVPLAEAKRRAVTAFETSFLTAALERHGGNVSATARQLGIHRQTLQKMLRRLKLDSSG